MTLGKAVKQPSKEAKPQPAAAAPAASRDGTGASGGPRLEGRELLAAAVILAVGFFIRLIFMPSTGHETDIGTLSRGRSAW